MRPPLQLGMEVEIGVLRGSHGKFKTHTMTPPKTPAMHRNKTICQNDFAMPKMDIDSAMPVMEKSSTGLRPTRSAARPHGIMTSI